MILKNGKIIEFQITRNIRRNYDIELLDHVKVSIGRFDGLLTVSRSLVKQKNIYYNIKHRKLRRTSDFSYKKRFKDFRRDFAE